MNVTESSIKFPITVIVRLLLVVVFGYVCLGFIDVELKPDTQPAVLAVITDYPGALPQEVEGQVNNRFEQYISGVSNLMATFGYCYQGQSLIFMLYYSGTNLDLAAAELQRNLERVEYLPPEVERPQILKGTGLITLPLFQFSISGNVDPVIVTKWADLDITPRIKRIPGVGDCDFRGGRTRQMRVSFDPERLKSRRLTVHDIKQYIDRTNINKSAGYYVDGNVEWTVRVLGERRDAQSFGRVLVSKPGESPVYLSDVATIRDIYQRPNGNCRINGKPGIVFNVYGEVGADVLKLIKGVKKELGKIEREYGPLGAEFNTTFDQSLFVDEAISIVKDCLILAGILIFVVLFLFLKRWRSILIVAISIPVSVIGTFIGMYLFGYSVNVISLAGLALAIGLIVDDSIVVLENIHRLRFQENMDPLRACVEGTREVGMAAFMSTLTIAAVFVPVLMLRGEIGTLFGPVAFVVSFAIFVSLLDAFTVVPMLAFRWMKVQEEPRGLAKKLMLPFKPLDRLGAWVAAAIAWTLRYFLASRLRKGLLVVSVLVLFGLSCLTLPGFDYLPVGGANLLQVNIQCIEGTSLEQKSSLMEVVEHRWKDIKGVRHVISTPHRNMFKNMIFVVCEDERDSGVAVSDIAHRVWETSKDLPFRSVDVITYPLFGNVYLRSNVIDFRIVGPSYKVIPGLVDQLMEIGKNTRGVVFRYTDLSLHRPQIDVRVDQERAQYFGLQVSDIGDAVEAAIGGQRTTSQYNVRDHYFYIRIMGDERHMNSLSDVRDIVLTSRRDPDIQVPLSSVASVEPSYGPLHITHFNSRRSTRVQFRVSDRSLNDTYQEVVSKMKATIDFPHGYAAMPFGSINLLRKLGDAMRFVFPLAAVVVYLLLVMQFQSFLRPVAIMFTVPLSLIGANLAVKILSIPFDAFTMLGYIMMIGLVVKNAILLVTYAVRLIDEKGIERDEALALASEHRIRPIFMTSIAMVFGMLPLALTRGAAAEIYNGMATVVVAGLSVATLFTLIFIPVVYTMLDDLKMRLWSGRSESLEHDQAV